MLNAAAADRHQVAPLDAQEDTFRCGFCGQVFISEAGFALCPLGQLGDARVRILAPEGHPLHQVTGIVTATFSAAWMWQYGRVKPMMTEPLAWPGGQVQVKLDTRPRVPDQPDPDWLWPPVVTVQPAQVELLAVPGRCGHLPPAGGEECDWCHQCPGCCACAAMRQGTYDTGEYRGA